MSKQTKEDLIKLYNIASDKIEVCYQSCNKIFEQTVADENKTKILKKYNLPANYLLYVGSIIERKNLLNICKALKNISTNNPIPLVVIGTGHGSYYSSVKQFVAENNLQNLVIFLSENEIAKNDIDFKSAVDFPAIYQSASALIYPSIYEGFGIPILEALWSNLPVITSNISCLPETGGDAAYYIDPFSVDDITNAILNVVSDSTLRQSMIEKGKRHTTNFTPQKCAETVMNVYHSLMR